MPMSALHLPDAQSECLPKNEAPTALNVTPWAPHSPQSSHNPCCSGCPLWGLIPGQLLECISVKGSWSWHLKVRCLRGQPGRKLKGVEWAAWMGAV